eukprot:GEZU01029611.1.p1 GENE.GEZU01029611.1~~GEZU01029611.1.p1  ORF type:complete len:175 (-),score=22.58 GEZU01029611.1:106-630(-)
MDLSDFDFSAEMGDVSGFSFGHVYRDEFPFKMDTYDIRGEEALFDSEQQFCYCNPMIFKAAEWAAESNSVGGTAGPKKDTRAAQIERGFTVERTKIQPKRVSDLKDGFSLAIGRKGSLASESSLLAPLPEKLNGSVTPTMDLLSPSEQSVAFLRTAMGGIHPETWNYSRVKYTV